MSPLDRIIAAYDAPVVRWYCRARARVIGQNLLPLLCLGLRDRRHVVEIGCGFGLFGLYLASRYQGLTYSGYDASAIRIRLAEQTAMRLGVTGATFCVADARTLLLAEPLDGVLLLDLLHHLAPAARVPLLLRIAAALPDDGRLVLKDVDTRPWWRHWWTWAADLAVSGQRVTYWSETTMLAALCRAFQRVEVFPMGDWLPYAHVLYVCEQPRRSSTAGRSLLSMLVATLALAVLIALLVAALQWATVAPPPAPERLAVPTPTVNPMEFD